MKKTEHVSGVSVAFWEHCRLALDVARDYRQMRDTGLDSPVTAERRFRRFCRGEDKIKREARARHRRNKLRRVK